MKYIKKFNSKDDYMKYVISDNLDYPNISAYSKSNDTIVNYKINIDDINIDSQLQTYLNYFSSILSISRSNQPVSYEFFKYVYKKALLFFEADDIWNYEIFKELTNVSGSEINRQTAKDSMIGWLFAMFLSELKPNSQTDFYTVGMNLSGGKNRRMYGYQFKSDVSIGEHVASVLYSIIHASDDVFTMIANVRTELNLPLLNSIPTEYTDIIDGMNVLPAAPVNNISQNPDFEFDQRIYNYIESNYSLSNPDTAARTRQALMDKEYCVGYQKMIIEDQLGLSFTPEIRALLNATMEVGKMTYHTVRSSQNPNERTRPAGAEKNIRVDYDIEIQTGCNKGEDWGCGTIYNETQQKSGFYAYNSYPSGHSAISWNVGLILIQLYPEHFDIIAKRYYEFAQDRTICRYHWNTDVMWGRIVGSTAIPVLNSRQEYITLFNAAKNSIKAQEPFTPIDENDIPYVSNGLVFYLDGINKGNDSSAWIDLINGRRFVSYNATRNNNSYGISDESPYKYLDYSGRLPYKGDDITVEICYKLNHNSQTAHLLFGGGETNEKEPLYYVDNNNVICWGQSQYQYQYNGTLDPSGYYTASINLDHGYLNGESLTLLNTTDYWSCSSSLVRIGWKIAGTGALTAIADIYSIRIYNRKLTSSEQLSNMQTDNERFNLGLTIY